MSCDSVVVSCHTKQQRSPLLSPQSDCTLYPLIYDILSSNQYFQSQSAVYFVAPKDGKKSSVVFKSLNFFLTKMAMFGITAARDCFTGGMSSDVAEVFTPTEIDSYNK